MTAKKTGEMERFEKETGKYAIWRGNITEAFRKWQNGETIYETDKKRVVILVSDEEKAEWDYFVKKTDSNISRLVRDSVKFQIEHPNLLDVESLSHNLKEPLTSIKGYLQILLKNYASNIEPKIFEKIEKINMQLSVLEEKVNHLTSLPEKNNTNENYDILIIEDDIATIDVLEEFFDLRGFRAKGINTGTKGLEELNRVKPKLILLDILLPDIDGYDICRKIKSDNRLKNIPVFYTTAVPVVEVNKKIKETGAEGLIPKPFDLDDFEILFKYL